MPYNGAGVFTRIMNWVNDKNAGINITASRMDTDSNDFASAFNNCLTRDGQGFASADLPMNGFKHTDVGSATARDQYAAVGQVQDGSFLWGGTAGGTADAITISPNPVITAYTAGQVFRFISSGANTITNPTLSVNGLGAETIVKQGAAALVAGDIPSGAIVEVVYDGTNFQLINLKKVSPNDIAISAPLVVSSGNLTLDLAQGQCRLTKSGSNLLLSPSNGNLLIINGVMYAVPDAGVTLAPTGLTPATLYYIYAYMNSGTMTLEASTTGHAKSTTAGNKGVEVKSGDDTRTLVGMARVVTGPAFADSATQRLVASYFNRRGIGGVNAFAASKTTASTTYAELSSTDGRVEFLTWGDEAVQVAATGCNFNLTASATYNTSIGFDGTTAEDIFNQGFTPSSVAGGLNTPVGISFTKNGLSEGYHYATILGSTTTGTATWIGGATAGLRTSISVMVRG
jgi:hypothetical protein